MRVEKFIGPILFSSGVLLGGCNAKPDFAEVLSLKCGTNPDSIATEQVDLKPGQIFTLANQSVTVISPGRLGINSSDRPVEVYGSDIYVNGIGNAFKDQRYKIVQTTVEDKTRLLISYNCADPENP